MSKEKLAIITPYPPRGTKYESKFSALAGFARNTVEGLIAVNPNIEITILADILDKKERWQENNLEVVRVWKRQSFLSYWNLLKELISRKKNRKILVELEWALFGKNPVYIIPFPIFTLILKLFFRKKIYIITHGVSLNFSELAPQLGLGPRSMKSKVYNFGLNAFYFLLEKSAVNLITLEKYLADKINEKLKTNKAVFIPHGVDTDLKIVKKEDARKKLGIDKDKFVIVSFGFLTWYKGSDKLAEIFSEYVKDLKDKNPNLIFAGGQSKTHKKDPHYQSFIEKLNDATGECPQISITGFVAEEDIPNYYSAADVIVFPYRRFISSSGPLSLAFSFERPVLLSSNMKNYLKSPDFLNSTKKTNLKEDQLFFELTSQGLERGIAKFKNNEEKFIDFSRDMKEKRNWQAVAQKHINLMFP